MDEPTPIDMVRELREAVGLFDGALPISPKAAWEDALEWVRYQRHLAQRAMTAANELVNATAPPPPERSWS